jgi:hypothetical protein
MNTIQMVDVINCQASVDRSDGVSAIASHESVAKKTDRMLMGQKMQLEEVFGQFDAGQKVQGQYPLQNKEADSGHELGVSMSQKIPCPEQQDIKMLIDQSPCPEQQDIKMLIDQSPRSVAFLYESGQMQEEMVLPSSRCQKEDGAQGVWSCADKGDRKKKSQVGNSERMSEFESGLDCDSDDTGQQKRWLEFLETNHAQFEEEKNLLRVMELLDDEQDQECEGQELSKETVAAIEVAKGID